MSEQELKAKYKQAVHDARTARDAALGLLQQFKQAEGKAENEEARFADINTAIAALDKGYSAEQLPTDQETFDYGEQRLALLAKRDQQLTVMQNARHFREQLRLETLRADRLYARLEQERHNLRNLMEGKLGKVEGGVFYVA